MNKGDKYYFTMQMIGTIKVKVIGTNEGYVYFKYGFLWQHKSRREIEHFKKNSVKIGG